MVDTRSSRKGGIHCKAKAPSEEKDAKKKTKRNLSHIQRAKLRERAYQNFGPWMQHLQQVGPMLGWFGARDRRNRITYKQLLQRASPLFKQKRPK